MDREKIIKEFATMIVNDYCNIIKDEISIESIFDTKDTIFIIRSCPLDQFICFLEKLNYKGIDNKILLVGKESDADVIEQYYKGSYEIINISQKYTAQEILKHKEVIDSNNPHKLIMFSTMISDARYLNIYEAVADINFEGYVYCIDCNMDIYYINDIGRYSSTLNLQKALSEWYWRICE